MSFVLAGADDETSIGVRDRILGAVKGVRLDDLVALNTDIVPKLMERVRPESMRLIEQHRDAGRDTYIVSASPIELVEPLAKALGMTAGIGTRSEIVDGVYTRRARRAVLLRPGQGRGDRGDRRRGGPRSRPVLGVQRLGQRSADAARPSATRWP